MKKRIVIVSICVGLILAGLTFIYFNNPNEGMGLIPCPIYLFTKLYCPGCGTGRAIYSLMHLEFFQAFRYNPLCMILLPFIIAYVVMVGLSY
ncbi:MAG: DUF2752 domain-containing protein, partial [Oscillospiraceae bacterium]